MPNTSSPQTLKCLFWEFLCLVKSYFLSLFFSILFFWPGDSPFLIFLSVPFSQYGQNSGGHSEAQTLDATGSGSDPEGYTNNKLNLECIHCSVLLWCLNTNSRFVSVAAAETQPISRPQHLGLPCSSKAQRRIVSESANLRTRAEGRKGTGIGTFWQFPSEFTISLPLLFSLFPCIHLLLDIFPAV